MRSFSLVLAFCASLAAAASSTGTATSAAASASTSPNAFNIPSGQSTYDVTAGSTVSLSWSNIEGSSVTIKLQANGYITPESGVVLAQSIPNSGAATVTIPSGSQIPAGAYVFEIIEDSNTSNYNFSPAFGIKSASGTGSFGSTASSTATGSSSSTGSSSASATTTSGSSSTSSSSHSASTSSSAASSTLSSAASTTRSTAAVQTTSVPTGNAGFKVQAPLAAAIMIGAAAML